MAAPHVLILGLGYVGTGLANRIVSKHPEWSVAGTVRSNRGAQERYPTRSTHAKRPNHSSFSRHHMHPYPLDVRVNMIEYGGAAEYVEMHGVTHVLCTIPPPQRARHIAGLERGDNHPLQVLRHIPRSDRVWTGYVSTTSVYGDHGGALVDEESALIPNERNKVCVEEDRAWFGRDGMYADVFRCGGIYGPYRNVLDSLTRQLGMENETESQTVSGFEKRTRAVSESPTVNKRREKATTMRCHVLDVCRVIEKRMIQWEEGRLSGSQHEHRVFNIVDDDPIGRRDVEDYALHESSLFDDYRAVWAPVQQGKGVTSGDEFRGDSQAQNVRKNDNNKRWSAHGTTPQILTTMHSDRRPLVDAEKCVSNRRIKDELGIELCFPSVLDGLQAIVYRGDVRPFAADG